MHVSCEKLLFDNYFLIKVGQCICGIFVKKTSVLNNYMQEHWIKMYSISADNPHYTEITYLIILC